MQIFDPELPQPQGTDKMIGLLRTIVAGVPAVGGLVTEAWSAFFMTPLAKRREAWLFQLATAVVGLQKRIPNLTLESLQQNEQFLSAVLNATSIAVRTHRKEKLAALRNAVKSSVLFPDIDEDEQSMFMKYVDDLTPWHLAVLSAFHDPNAHFRKRGSDMQWLVNKDGTLWSTSKNTFVFMSNAFPELASNHQFAGQLLYDLGARQLIAVQQLFHQELPDVGPYTTLTGQKFMKFIGDPL